MNSQTTVIDPKAIEQIRALQQPNGENLLGSIISLFIDESARLQGCIAEAIENSDCDAVRQYAHSLKSCSANVGAVEVTSLSVALETAGRDGELAGLDDLMSKLQSNLKTAIFELQTLISL